MDETGQPLTAFCEIRLEFTLAAVARETAGIFATRPLNINARYVSVCPEPGFAKGRLIAPDRSLSLNARRGEEVALCDERIKRRAAICLAAVIINEETQRAVGSSRAFN